MKKYYLVSLNFVYPYVCARTPVFANRFSYLRMKRFQNLPNLLKSHTDLYDLLCIIDQVWKDLPACWSVLAFKERFVEPVYDAQLHCAQQNL